MTFSNVEHARVWFITGASSGLGYEFTKKALELGDKVVGIARNIEKLNELKSQYEEMLLPLRLDVTNRSDVFATVETAIKHFGKIIQISSIGGLISGPMSGIYSASKFALEGFSEALAQEAAHFGIKVTIVEPGGYWTNLYLKMGFTVQNQEYDSLREELAKQYSTDSVDSDPKLAAEAILKMINSENPPLRLILGSIVYDLAIENAEKRISTWKEWESVSRSAEHGIPAPEGYGIIE